MAKTILGIDLGTTYSCVAYINTNGQAEVLTNADGKPTTPSVVWFDGQRVVVGQEAKEMSAVQPDSVCSFVKRNMGNDSFTFDVDGTAYSASDISSLILKKLVKDASENLGKKIEDVVITVPAYFSFREREATKRAGELAGLNVLQLVNEPTAAAFAYGVRPDNAAKEQQVLVYDLGGGTFDTTLIRISKTGTDVICTDGNHQLGGKDWDDRLVQNLLQRFNDQTGSDVNLNDDIEFANDLLAKAESLKVQLSSKMTAKTSIVFQGNKLQIEITRDEFEQLTEDLVEQTLELTRNMIDAAKKKGVRKFDKLLLVGGSAKMPMIAKSLKHEFNIEPQIFEPDEAVAKGAACIGNPTYKIPVKNVASKTFGITVLDGYDANQVPQLSVSNLIYRNTTLPAEITEQFGTIAKNQRVVVVELVESNHDAPPPDEDETIIDIAETTALWAGDLTIQPNLPMYSLIDITFRINANGQLEISAFDPASGNQIYKAIPEVAEDLEIKKKIASLQII